MSAVLRITHLDVRPSWHDYSILEIILENIGADPINPGALMVHEFLTDGSARAEKGGVSSLAPGQRIKLSHAVQGPIKELAFRNYQSSDGAATVPLSGLLSW